jgi:phosphatidylserine/phosphatidylglycerophosphate/cardiolipin synthase-like enzyme
MRLKAVLWLSLGLCLCSPAQAASTLPLQGTVTVAFTPGDDAAALIIEAIDQATQQILVQAYSFTHRGIADALVAAHGRDIDVRVLADPEQMRRIETSLIGHLRDRGVPVYLDGRHGAAHDKVMIIDTGLATATLITGSFNFSHAAQYRNAENLLILRGVRQLTELYADNWRRHRAHSLPLRP